MKRNLILLALLFPLFTIAQNDTLFPKKLRVGFGFFAGGGIWKQDNLNKVLEANNIPGVRSGQFGGGFEAIYQWNKFRLLLSLGGTASQLSKRSENIYQNFSGLELGGNYAIIRNKSIRLAPLVGAGFLSGYTQIRKDAVNQTYGQLFSGRNTAELYNSQGYLNLGAGLGFCYSPIMKEHLYEISAGYKLGFAASGWSTDMERQAISQGVSDEIRQFYVKFKINILSIRRSHWSNRN